MNKTKYALLRTPVVALALLCVLSACEMGFEQNQQKNALVDTLAPVITSHPQSVGVNVGEAPVLSVLAILPEGVTGTLQYQWYQFLTYRAYQDQAGIPIPYAVERTFTPPTNADGEYNYYVVVTNNNMFATGRATASVKSNPVTVTLCQAARACPGTRASCCRRWKFPRRSMKAKAMSCGTSGM